MSAECEKCGLDIVDDCAYCKLCRILQETYADISIILASFDSTVSDPKRELEALHARLHEVVKEVL